MVSINLFLTPVCFAVWRQATHSKYTNLITPARGAAHLSEQSRRPASNQRAADRAAVNPPFPAKSRSAKAGYARGTRMAHILTNVHLRRVNLCHLLGCFYHYFCSITNHLSAKRHGGLRPDPNNG
jgi:hypothetical protein